MQQASILFIAGMRLLGIARNEYIDIMNKYRSKVHYVLLLLY